MTMGSSLNPIENTSLSNTLQILVKCTKALSQSIEHLPRSTAMPIAISSDHVLPIGKHFVAVRGERWVLYLSIEPQPLRCVLSSLFVRAVGSGIARFLEDESFLPFVLLFLPALIICPSHESVSQWFQLYYCLFHPCSFSGIVRGNQNFSRKVPPARV